MAGLFGDLIPNTGADGKPLDIQNPTTLPEDEPGDEYLPIDDSTPDPGKAGEVPEQEEVEAGASQEEGFSYLDVAENLGVFQPKEGKEYDDSEEGFRELAQDTIEAVWEEKYGLADEEDLAYLAFRKQGGTNQQWLEQTTPSYENADLEDVDTQKALLTAQYEAQGLKPEAITKKIDRLEKAGTLEEEAQDAQEFLVEREAQQTKDFQAQVLQREKDQEEARKQSLVSLQTDIEGSTELGGIPLSKPLKQALYQHITRPVGPKGETQYQLNQREKGKALTAALLDMLDITSEDVAKKQVTKQATSLQQTLKKASKGTGFGSGQNVRTATPTGNKIPTKGMPWSS